MQGETEMSNTPNRAFAEANRDAIGPARVLDTDPETGRVHVMLATPAEEEEAGPPRSGRRRARW